jgi:iron(III) transport system ATP-binding protein
MVLLSVQKLSKKQDNFHLTDISIDVSANEVLAILGESGSGKTSLLRLIAGLDKPDGGQIILRGKTLAGPQVWVTAQERPIGLSFQEAWLFPRMTVSKNIQAGIRSKSKQERAEKTQEWLDLLGLGDFAHRYPRELSGGEQQRIALARALVTEPELMLFDEPFSKLDAARRSRLRTDVARLLKHTQTAAIIVTHDVEDVYALADRVAILENGKLVQHGKPQEVYLYPKDAYAARLFGPANIVTGQRLQMMGVEGVEGVEGNVSYCVRPEQIKLKPAKHADAFRITEQHFHGNTYQLSLAGKHGDWIVNTAERQDEENQFELEILLSSFSPLA